MTGGEFSLSDIAFGESLIRVSAHLDSAVEVYSRGDHGGALVHANRSLELMPAISSELWRDPALATALNQAAAGVATWIRQRKPAVQAAAVRDAFDSLSAGAVRHVVGESATSEAYRGSVVVALLRTAAAAHEAGVGNDARALANRARSLAATLWGGAMWPEAVEKGFAELTETISKGAPADAKAAVAELAQALYSAFGARLELDAGPRDRVDRTAQLLRHAHEAARAGDRFRAGKLVGRAYVEEYRPARESIPDWEADELDDLVGTRLRLALAAGDPIDDLLYRALELLAAAPV